MSLKVEEILRKIEEVDKELSALEEKRRAIATKVDEIIEKYRRALSEELSRELERIIAEYGESEVRTVDEEVNRIRGETAQRREALLRTFEEKKGHIISSVIKELLG